MWQRQFNHCEGLQELPQEIHGKLILAELLTDPVVYSHHSDKAPTGKVGGIYKRRQPLFWLKSKQHKIFFDQLHTLVACKPICSGSKLPFLSTTLYDNHIQGNIGAHMDGQE